MIDAITDLILIMGFFGVLFTVMGILGKVFEKIFWPDDN